MVGSCWVSASLFMVAVMVTGATTAVGLLRVLWGLLSAPTTDRTFSFFSFKIYLCLERREGEREGEIHQRVRNV